MKVNNKVIFSWYIYDLANTAFSALFVTFFFPFFVKEFLHGTEFHVGLVIGISMLLAAIFVPILGALSDIIGKRMPFLIFFTILCVVFTALVAFVNLPLALIFAVIANFSYQSSLIVYDAILPSIAARKELGKISGYGTGIGYLGTLLSLGVAFIVLKFFSTTTQQGYETLSGIKAMFPTTALFFIIFSIPIFVYVKDKIKKEIIPLKQGIVRSFKELKNTIKNLQKYRGLVPFLVAAFMYNDAINTVILFLFLFIREAISITVIDFMKLFLLFSTAAAIGSIIYGKVVDKIGPKNSLNIALLLWILVTSLLIVKTTFVSIIIVGIMGGVAMGAIWTAARPMLIFLSPEKKFGEFFGFRGLVGKASGIIGPVLFGFIVTKWNYTYGLTLLLLFFIVAFLILQKVPNIKAK
tara:strand:+ start:1491 stop:2720 length:1230 start_codon:yes stop_codon:yes gene_type:complete